MSNGNTFERLWKLQAMVNKLVLDGKRDPERVCDVLQAIIEEPSASKSMIPVEDRPAVSQGQSAPLNSLLLEMLGVVNLPSNAFCRLVRRRLLLIGELVQIKGEQLFSHRVLNKAQIADVDKVLAMYNLQLGMNLPPEVRATVLRKSKERLHNAIYLPLFAADEEWLNTLCEGCGDLVVWCGDGTPMCNECQPYGKGETSKKERQLRGEEARRLEDPSAGDLRYNGFLREGS